MYPHFWYPSKMVLTTASQYMVVAVTIERYSVIVHEKSTTLKYYNYTALVLVFASLVNLPKFFEFQSIPSHDSIQENTNIGNTNYLNSEGSENLSKINGLNGSTEKDNGNPYSYKISKLGEDEQWYIFDAYHKVFIIGFCLFVIVYCNFRVWLQILKSALFKKNR